MVINICLHKALSNGILSKGKLHNDNCGSAYSRRCRDAVHRDFRVCTSIYPKMLQKLLLEMQYANRKLICLCKDSTA